MTITLVPDALPSLFDEDADDGGPTLEAVVRDAWEGLTTRHVAACPVCGGAVAPRFGAGSAPVGGRCTACGSELS
jgi:hypothetical protein